LFSRFFWFGACFVEGFGFEIARFGGFFLDIMG
jgi:hypothetical protein